MLAINMTYFPQVYLFRVFFTVVKKILHLNVLFMTIVGLVIDRYCKKMGPEKYVACDL